MLKHGITYPNSPRGFVLSIFLICICVFMLTMILEQLRICVLMNACY